MDAIPFLERKESQITDDFTVTVAVLTREEANRAFGIDLADKGIQPVWIEIENHTDEIFWFMLHGLDPNYFSAREAAYKSHYRFRPATNTRIDDHFGRHGIDQNVPPRSKTAGYARVPRF